MAAADPRTMYERERGASLIELMVALVLLAIGILTLLQLFPSGSRTQQRDRMLTAANYYAQERLEQIQSLPKSHPDLFLGAHAVQTLGPRGQWRRTHTVAQLAKPLENLKKVTVTVAWTAPDGDRQVQTATYIKR